MSGYPFVTALQIFFKNVVLPDPGDDTTRARCPIPIGQIRSRARTDKSSLPFSRIMRGCGFIAVPARNFFSSDEATLRADSFERCSGRDFPRRDFIPNELIYTPYFLIFNSRSLSWRFYNFFLFNTQSLNTGYL
jgi:hypothetical protein